jgi:hypothetical protein
MRETDEEKSERRYNRAMLAAGAAVVMAVTGASYAVYRVQEVLKGMRINQDTTATLYNEPNDPYLNVNEVKKK